MNLIGYDEHKKNADTSILYFVVDSFLFNLNIVKENAEMNKFKYFVIVVVAASLSSLRVFVDGSLKSGVKGKYYYTLFRETSKVIFRMFLKPYKNHVRRNAIE